MSGKRYVYSFEQGDGKNKMLLGGKGANLCEMTQIGLNVPPGFTLTTEACLAYLAENRLPEGLMEEVRTHIAELERKTGKFLGYTHAVFQNVFEKIDPERGKQIEAGVK